MKERIKTVMKVYNLRKVDFAKLLDVSGSSISHILDGRNNPGLPFTQKFLEVFPNISAEWFVMGVGAMTKEEGASNEQVIRPGEELEQKLTAASSDRLDLFAMAEQDVNTANTTSEQNPNTQERVSKLNFVQIEPQQTNILNQKEQFQTNTSGQEVHKPIAASSDHVVPKLQHYSCPKPLTGGAQAKESQPAPIPEHSTFKTQAQSPPIQEQNSSPYAPQHKDIESILVLYTDGSVQKFKP